MTVTRRTKWFLGAVALAVIAALFLFTPGRKGPAEVVREVRPRVGAIETSVTTTAVIQPQNRLEVKPPINGRIDRIFVKEGDVVEPGQILAEMSSTERAALLDAARARGPEETKRWEEVYKPTPLVAPIAGEVIVSQDEPGQVVTAADAVLVLSDRLIVQAQVDETDIGGVRVGQPVAISLDAYPAVEVGGVVDHIYYESQIVNNVTIYQVDIIPETVPEVFRSGMTATVTIIERSKKDALLIPLEAVHQDAEGAYVTVRERKGAKPARRRIELGLADDGNVEVLSGLTPQDTVLVTSQAYALKKHDVGSNPFMPFRKKKGK